MKTQSVMTQAANIFGSTVSNVAFKGKSKENDFDKLMNSNLKSLQNNSGKSDNLTFKKTVDQSVDKQVRFKNEKNTKSDSLKNQTSKVDSKVSDQKTKETTKVTNDEKDDDLKTNRDSTKDQQLLIQIQELLANVQQSVMDKLDLTNEELNRMLESQGLGLADLLQADNLQHLVLANSGQADIISTLTDENLADTMKQLLQNLDELKSGSQLELTSDQIKSFLEQAKARLIETSVISEVTEQMQNQSDKAIQTESNVSQSSLDQKDTGISISEATTASETSNTDASKVDTGPQTSSNSDSDNNLNHSNSIQTFVDNLVNVSQNSELTSDAAKITNLREIANQIIEHIKVSISSDRTSMELQLNPESLGKVNLAIHSKEGVITAHFVVQSELSKEAIESQIQTLRETLQQQGVKVEAIEVTVSANAFGDNNFTESHNQTDTKENSTRKQISLDEAMNMTEDSLDESVQEDITGIRGSLVDYTA